MSSRRMIYPYTLTAKFRNTPFKWHYDNNWYFGGLAWSILIVLPIMVKLQKLSYSEGNVKAMEEYRAKEKLEIEAHKMHLL